jgi:alpha/beta superfamily hydrolase
MTEERVLFQADGRLEGMLGSPAPAEAMAGPKSRGGVVVAHPYPPHGATMDLPMVYRIARSCRERGFTTLRFNFRSVGGSEGSFSGTEEHRDVTAAVSFLAGELAAREGERAKGLPLALAGYSFGSIMAARAAADLPAVRAMVLVGFVVRWEHLPPDTLDRLARYRGPLLAVCAENDDVGAPEDVRATLKRLGLDFSLEVVPGVDHFLQGRHREVGELVGAFIEEALGT